MPSKLEDIIVEAADYWEAIQPKTGQMWHGNDHSQKSEKRYVEFIICKSQGSLWLR